MSGSERRATVRLLRYWESLRQKDGVPWFSDFRPARNPVAWDRCVLLVLSGDGEPSVEHLGEAFKREALAGLGRAALKQAAGLSRSQLPKSEDGEIAADDGRRVLYRSICLPFRDASHEVRYGLGAVTWQGPT